MSKKMHKLHDDIVSAYKKAGYQQVASPDESTLCFKNDFSIHLVFIFDSLNSLKMGWEAAHTRLIDEYRRFEGPPDMEWNYYCLFIVPKPLIDKDELRRIRAGIEANTAYSRKFVLTDHDINEIPPGMISSEMLRSRKVETQNPLETWEEVIGRELLTIIVGGPKSAIEERLRSYIESLENGK